MGKLRNRNAMIGGSCLFAILLIAGPGCTKDPLPKKEPAEKKVAMAEKQKVSPLTEADRTQLDEQRDFVTKHLADDESKQKFETAAGKLGTIRALLESKKYKASQSKELQSLGVVLGDAFVKDMGMEWVVVEDEFGRDVAISLPNTTILLFPVTMILKRVERGENVDVFDLYNGVADQVEQIKNKSK